MIDIASFSVCAIILAAGRGSRMNSNVPKQYMPLLDKPVLYYSLAAFEKSNVDEIILVVSCGEEQYCWNQMIHEYKITKVKKVVSGGAERYLSVLCGLQEIGEHPYVLIHDGARPMVTADQINEMIDHVKIKKACIFAVPAKDTVKLVDKDGQITATPNRDGVYLAQTPQGFETKLIKESYKEMLSQQKVNITDDAMMVEAYTSSKVYVIKGDYRNIKLTTPEDFILAKEILSQNDNIET